MCALPRFPLPGGAIVRGGSGPSSANLEALAALGIAGSVRFAARWPRSDRRALSEAI
jgi:hypothetical protein